MKKICLVFILLFCFSTYGQALKNSENNQNASKATKSERAPASVIKTSPKESFATKKTLFTLNPQFKENREHVESILAD